MKLCCPAPRTASTLIFTLLVLSSLSVLAAVAATRILPRLPLAYQNAAWEEARLGAEAGVDTAINDLIANLASASPDQWPGWQVAPGGGNGPAAALALAQTKGPAKPKKPPKPPKPPGPPAPPPPPTPVSRSSPIFVSNLKVSTPASIPTEVNIQLWALESTAASQRLWFRIRSMGTCALPPAAYRAPEPEDPALRRLSLRAVRPSLLKDQVGQPGTVPLPNVSRVVEALVEPVLPFELAIWTRNTLSLCPTGTWAVDSYDASDPAKSLNGLYPGRGSPLLQANGNVACSKPRPGGFPYGALVAANGASVQGAVATNGGDDPSTPAHENVSGTLGLDTTRIRDDFIRAMSPVPLPQGTFLPRPASGPYLAGPADEPTQYLVSGSLTSLRIKGPGGTTNGLIIIVINGDLTLTGPLIIPASVTAVLYVRGNITFNDNVNSGTWSSKQPAQLLIFGEGSGPSPQHLDAHGNISVCAAFYGPNYAISLDGGVDWCGSLAGSDFTVATSGSGGVHYDESLAVLGPPISFRIIRYEEDVRE